MWSREALRVKSQLAAFYAARNAGRPYLVRQEDIDAWKAAWSLPRLPFPFTGTRRWRGYRLSGRYVVDSSRYGLEYEPTLTIAALIERLKPDHGYAIIEADDCRVIVGEFKPRDTLKADRPLRVCQDCGGTNSHEPNCYGVTASGAR